MMKNFQNHIRLAAQMAMQAKADSKPGMVTSYDPDTYSVKVLLQPDDVETGWLPVLSSWVGNGWGMFSPPTPGETVLVQFFGNDIDSGFIVSRFSHDEARPLSVNSGEFWLVHASGASFKLTNDGKAAFSDGHGATVTLNGDGTITSAANQWDHTGPLNVSGDVDVTGKVTASSDITTSAGNINATDGTVTAPHLDGTIDVKRAGTFL